MKTWQLGLMGVALAAAMTACPSGRGGDAVSSFPVKAGETWAADFTASTQKLTVGFQLDGAPEFDKDGDIVADLVTTDNVKGGVAFVLTKDNLFFTQFVINAADRTFLFCGTGNDANLAKGVKATGFLSQNGKKTADVPCTLRRAK
jgi:hypothetical protein